MKKSIFFLAVSIVSLFTKAQLPNINLVQVATGFNKPLDLKNCGDNRLFVVEQAGKIRILSKAGVINATPFLTLDSVKSTGNEQGLLSLAFSPNYKQDGFFYVNYIFNNGTNTGITRISRFNVNPADSNLADASSEKVLLTISQPYTNHNGATLMFGKDGYLYDSQGDGGSADDPQGNGQNKNTLLAKMLRLDVSNPDTTYTVPATNPFVGVANTKPEIWLMVCAILGAVVLTALQAICGLEMLGRTLGKK
jgi:glucose/arabinose dehydrogenase